MPHLCRRSREQLLSFAGNDQSAAELLRGPGVRDDSGVYEGWTVPVDYDPLISKLVAWAPSRDEVIQRMLRALKEYQVEGIQTNLGFFREVLNDSDFRKGKFDTGFIDRWLQRRGPRPSASPTELDMASIAAALRDSVKESGPATSPELRSSWKTAARLRGLRR